jgi:hypothetical protein
MLSMVRIFPTVVIQAKNNTLKRDLTSPNTLPREVGVNMTYKNVIERSNGKHPSLGRHPPKLVFPSPSQSKRVQQVKERNKDILSRSNKVYIPLIGITR